MNQHDCNCKLIDKRVEEKSKTFESLPYISQKNSDLLISSSRSFLELFTLVIICALVLSQIVTFSYLYGYMREVEKKCSREIQTFCGKRFELNTPIRTKRDTKIEESDSQHKEEEDSILRLNSSKFREDDKYVLDEPIQIQNDSISAESGDTEWVWLNDYSRIPIKSVRTYCSKMQEYCPPAPKGEQGSPGNVGIKGDHGDKGDKGERGESGIKGIRGNKGATGLKGDRGETGSKGDQGIGGLHGRDGAPGEPGLDGVPGRHGKDGTPGTNGIPGRDGIPGIFGQDGRDGTPGEKGEPGPQGPPGPTGLPGPRGKMGRSGTDGNPGIPGIQAWNGSFNGSSVLLLPPSIIGSEPQYMLRSIVVHERENIRLRCITTGYPKPKVVWRKIDGSNLVPILETQWGDINTGNEVLNFPNISRRHMGEYMCLASNGVPPSANQTYSIKVHFSPLIEIRRPIVNVTVGGTARLECITEAYPRGVYYWETKTGDLIEETFGRYRVESTHYARYKTKMQLNITNVRESELGAYMCISKNDEGLVKGYLNVTDLDISEILVMPKPPVEPSVTQIYGTKPPPLVGPLCPECEKCKVCGFGYRDLEIQSLGNASYPRLPKKIQKCELDTIGKPVYHNSLNMTYGSWMKDLQPRFNEESIWVTLQNDTDYIYEYANKQTFTSKVYTDKHRLPYTYAGNSHVLYYGVLYYNQKYQPSIVRYDLIAKKPLGVLYLPYGNVSSKNSLLYKTHYKYIDISMDENGLWAIYDVSGNTGVVKINHTSFEIEHAWNISVRHQDVGEMFIVCGILYAIDSVTDFRTKISLALDLYEKKLIDEQIIPFTNPFGNTTTVNFNYKTKELYTWDAGNMLSYPIRIIHHNEQGDLYNGTQDNSSNGSDVPVTDAID